MKICQNSVCGIGSMMVSKRAKIKKIDNASARRVTFSKRRRGLLKKAEELSVLCDVDVAVILFSSNDKLFTYSSSSMEEVLERRSLHSRNIEKLNQPSLELQRLGATRKVLTVVEPGQTIKVTFANLVEDTNYANLSKEVAEMTLQLRQMRGEELQGLSIEELHELEKSLEAGLSMVVAKKGEVIMNEICHLQEKEVKLMEENDKLKEELLKISNARKQIICDFASGDDGELSESIDICNSGGTPQDYESSGTSLKLG